VRQVPVRIEVPPGAPIGQTYQLQVQAFTPRKLTNPAAPPDSPYASHTFFERVAGVLLTAHTVLDTRMRLTAQRLPDGALEAKGGLEPAIAGAIVAVDYTGPDGKTVTHTLRTDGNGAFRDRLAEAGLAAWNVRALWQGDRESSSAVSELVRVEAGKGWGSQLPATPSPFAVTAVALTAQAGQVSGKCPLTVTFTGSITTNGPGSVTYTFLRSDGATGPNQTLKFSAAATQEVATTWTLGDATVLPAYDGWQAVRVVEPNPIESSPEAGSFSMRCEPGLR
jgi:hypothetical protein